MSDKIIIYTDGACSGNPGPGGWGAILMYKGQKKEISGGNKQTTNNIMEVTAAPLAVFQPFFIQLYIQPCLNALTVYALSLYI